MSSTRPVEVLVCLLHLTHLAYSVADAPCSLGAAVGSLFLGDTKPSEVPDRPADLAGVSTSPAKKVVSQSVAGQCALINHTYVDPNLVLGQSLAVQIPDDRGL